MGPTRDFNQRNTTASVGFSYSHDRLTPEGGIPVPFASMSAVGAPLPRRGDSDSRNIIDGIAGVTQVLGRSTIGRLNYSLTRSTGYLTDPYKLLSVVEAPGSPAAGNPTDYIFEKRPQSRTRQSIYSQVRKHLGRDVIDVSYRFMWDSWSVTSHTADLRYRWALSARHSVTPHFRYYHQQAADFYQRFLIDGSPRPDHATADYRLGVMDAFTMGAKLGGVVIGGQQLSFGFGILRTARRPPTS